MVQTDSVFSGVGGKGIRDGQPTERHQAMIEREKAREAKKLANSKSGKAPVTSSTVIAPLTAAERAFLILLSTLAAPTVALPKFTASLQELKGALYDKDYHKAFGIGATAAEKEKVELFHDVYAARYVPARALVYRRLFEEFGITTLMKNGGTAVLLGGGAGSELLALGSVMLETKGKEVAVHVVDSADWKATIGKQHSALLASTTPPTAPETFTSDFHLGDVLSLSSLTALPLSTSRLFTLFFTISELFLQSRAQTLHFLHHLTTSASKGTLLIIVESASLGQVPVGKDGRTYGLGMMLDHAMEMGAKWDTVTADDSRWCRMPPGVEGVFKSVKLENMRVFIRVYRRN